MSPAITVAAIGTAVFLVGCTPREPVDDTAPAPADTVPVTDPVDSTLAPDTSVATPPINPSQSELPQDTPPAGTPKPDSAAPQGGGKVSQAEYDGWRQYSVNCARCHGQDALPNPVAANLLISVGPGGPMRSEEKFLQVVSEGRPERGMPGFKSILSPEQSRAIYAYVKGRADKRIPPGRPAAPAG
jgi:mono/diheme cytochrome c family protein